MEFIKNISCLCLKCIKEPIFFKEIVSAKFTDSYCSQFLIDVMKPHNMIMEDRDVSC